MLISFHGGLEDKDNSSASFEIDGKSCTDVRIERLTKATSICMQA